MADGVFTLVANSQTGSVAVSTALAERLEVAVGNSVLLGSPAHEPLEIGAIVEYAPDTRREFFVLDPTAVSSRTVEQVLSSSASTGSARWIVETSDQSETLEYLDSVGAQVTLRSAFEAAPASLPIDARVLLAVLAAAAALAAALLAGLVAGGAVRRDSQYRLLGVSRARTAGGTVLQSALGVAMGVLLAIPLSLLLSVSAVHFMERAVGQDWGRLHLEAVTFVAPALGFFIALPLIILRLVRLHAWSAEHRDSQPQARGKSRTTLGAVGRRLSSQGSKWTAPTAALLIGVICAMGGGFSIVSGLAEWSARQSSSAPIPPGYAAVGLPRTLSVEEMRSLAAQSGGDLFQYTRVAFTTDESGVDVPVATEFGLSGCMRSEGLTVYECFDRGSDPDRFVAVADPGAAEGLLGRRLSTQERQALEEGDGLALTSVAAGEVELIAPGGYHGSDEDFSQVIAPLHVEGFDDFDRMPGFLVSDQWVEENTFHRDDSPRGQYILRFVDGEPAEASIRENLPSDVGAIADVLVPGNPPGLDLFRQLGRVFLIGSSTLVAAVAVLVVFGIATAGRFDLLQLRLLGMSDAQLRRIVGHRALRIFALAALLGIGLCWLGAWLFARTAGAPLIMTSWHWLIPFAVALTCLVLGAGLAPRITRAGGGYR